MTHLTAPGPSGTTPALAWRSGSAGMPSALCVAVAVTIATTGAPLGVVTALVFAVAAAVVDARTGRLPDGIVVPVGTILLVAALLPPDDGELWAITAGAALMSLPLLVLHVVEPEAMGFGDVKLAVGLGAVLGRLDWRLGVVALALGAAVSLVWALVTWRRSIAFGPGLVTGTLLAIGAALALGGTWT